MEYNIWPFPTSESLYIKYRDGGSHALLSFCHSGQSKGLYKPASQIPRAFSFSLRLPRLFAVPRVIYTRHLRLKISQSPNISSGSV